LRREEEEDKKIILNVSEKKRLLAINDIHTQTGRKTERPIKRKRDEEIHCTITSSACLQSLSTCNRLNLIIIKEKVESFLLSKTKKKREKLKHASS
jgi:hypothetical protein